MSDCYLPIYLRTRSEHEPQLNVFHAIVHIQYWFLLLAIYVSSSEYRSLLKIPMRSSKLLRQSSFLPIVRFIRMFQVTVPGGRKRDRKDDLLVIRDNGNSFKIIHVVAFNIPNHFFWQSFWIPLNQRYSSLLCVHIFCCFFQGERDDPTTVIEREEEWTKTREDMEKHLRKLRDFSVSNWFQKISREKPSDKKSSWSGKREQMVLINDTVEGPKMCCSMVYNVFWPQVFYQVAAVVNAFGVLNDMACRICVCAEMQQF